MAKANINFSNKAGSQAQVMRLVIRIASKTKKKIVIKIVWNHLFIDAKKRKDLEVPDWMTSTNIKNGMSNFLPTETTGCKLSCHRFIILTSGAERLYVHNYVHADFLFFFKQCSDYSTWNIIIRLSALQCLRGDNITVSTIFAELVIGQCYAEVGRVCKNFTQVRVALL